VEKIICLQREVMLALTESSKEKRQSKESFLNIVMEHFSFEMQHLLEGYQQGDLNMDQLVGEYAQIGTEGHDILAYKDVLEHARDNKGRIKLHAGFIPRTYARQVMREGEEAALKEAIAKDYIPADVTSLEGTDIHYNLFESMITGRNMHDENLKPNDNYKKIFKAQLIKDYAMAHYVCKLLKKDTEEQKYLVIAGNGHQQHYCGIPERVLRFYPELKPLSALIIAHESDYEIDLGQNEEHVLNGVKAAYGSEGSNPADYLYVYEEDAEEEDVDEENRGEQVKKETAEAYDRVGQTAHLRGDLKKAKAVMSYLGYSDAEFGIAGEDACNYQGVGNPHNLAKIQPGEKVLDLGSGLGVDSFIAATYAGPEGRVIGLDISKAEVVHAEKRAEARGLNMKFLQADMENIPLPDSTIDVIISNGAFCLAPNKEKAFSEIYRVLKPGGRMSICTSTVKMDLQPGVNWPVCMQMFIHISELEPICSKLGFQSISIDNSNSLMTFELPGEAEEIKKQ